MSELSSTGRDCWYIMIVMIKFTVEAPTSSVVLPFLQQTIILYLDDGHLTFKETLTSDPEREDANV